MVYGGKVEKKTIAVHPLDALKRGMIPKEEEAMVESSMEVMSWIRKRISEADTDVLRELVEGMASALMSAEANARCGAGYGQVSEDRVNSRNGYRVRDWDTRAGTISLSIPKLRQGSYFPDWLLQPRRRAERALFQVVSECYVRGVSTRRVDGLVKSMGVKGVSKSQVSEMAKELDSMVDDFRNRPLDNGPYRYLWLDAISQRVREGGRVVNVAAVIATAVNNDGRRDILGFDIFTTENGAGWTAFLRSLVARGLSGVQLVVSDAHSGLKSAVEAVLTGASWQRCRTHFMVNLLNQVPKRARTFAATLVRSIFDNKDAKEVLEQHQRVVGQLQERFPEAAAMLDQAGVDILAFTAFPVEHWRQIWSNNPQERLNREIRRRTDVVGIFPNRNAIIRLMGAVLAEQNDEWLLSRRYMSLESLGKVKMLQSDGDRRVDMEELHRIAA